MRNRQNEQGFLVIIVGVILVIVAIVFIIGLFTSHSENSASSSPSPAPKATTVAKMQAIHNQLSASWQVCQIDPSKCQASAAQITSSDDVFNGVSSQYSGNTLDDFTGWKQGVSIAEGDMKQWAINAIFSKDNTLLSAAVPKEIQSDQDTITSFTSDN